MPVILLSTGIVVEDEIGMVLLLCKLFFVGVQTVNKYVSRHIKWEITENVGKKVTFQIENNAEDISDKALRGGLLGRWPSSWYLKDNSEPTMHAQGWLREFEMQGTVHTETSKQDRSQGVVRAIVRARGQEAREKSSQDS